MIFAILTIVITVLSIVISRYHKIKSDYILPIAILIIGAFDQHSKSEFLSNVIIALICLMMIIILNKTDVNIFPKISTAVLILSLLLLTSVFLFEPVNGAYRYIEIGQFILQPAQLIIFCLFPLCPYINKMKQLMISDVFMVLLIAAIELILIVLQPNVKPAIIAFAVIFAILFKAKKDNRIKVNSALLATPFCVITGILLAVYVLRYGEIVLTRGAVDPLGRGYSLSLVDSITKQVRFLGNADLSLSGVQYPDSFLNFYPMLKAAVSLGWLPLICILFLSAILISKMFSMSNKVKNSFARYMIFGSASYFSFKILFDILNEFVIGDYPSGSFLLGLSTDALLDSVLIGISLSLYRNREKITFGRQLDIDYSMSRGVLKAIRNGYKQQLKNSNNDLISAHYKNRISEIDREYSKLSAASVKEQNSNTSFNIGTQICNYSEEVANNTQEKDLVFISYNHFDVKYASYLATCIENEGLRTWHFKRDMKSEQGTNDYAVAIMSALRRAKIVIIILSKNSVTSDHVKNEVCLAFNQLKTGTILMPIILEEAELDETLKYFLCRQDITDALPPKVKTKLEQFAKKVAIAFA